MLKSKKKNFKLVCSTFNELICNIYVLIHVKIKNISKLICTMLVANKKLLDTRNSHKINVIIIFSLSTIIFDNTNS